MMKVLGVSGERTGGDAQEHFQGSLPNRAELRGHWCPSAFRVFLENNLQPWLDTQLEELLVPTET